MKELSDTSIVQHFAESPQGVMMSFIDLYGFFTSKVAMAIREEFQTGRHPNTTRDGDQYFKSHTYALVKNIFTERSCSREVAIARLTSYFSKRIEEYGEPYPISNGAIYVEGDRSDPSPMYNGKLMAISNTEKVDDIQKFRLLNPAQQLVVNFFINHEGLVSNEECKARFLDFYEKNHYGLTAEEAQKVATVLITRGDDMKRLLNNIGRDNPRQGIVLSRPFLQKTKVWQLLIDGNSLGSTSEPANTSSRKRGKSDIADSSLSSSEATGRLPSGITDAHWQRLEPAFHLNGCLTAGEITKLLSGGTKNTSIPHQGTIYVENDRMEQIAPGVFIPARSTQVSNGSELQTQRIDPLEIVTSRIKGLIPKHKLAQLRKKNLNIAGQKGVNTEEGLKRIAIGQIGAMSDGDISVLELLVGALEDIMTRSDNQTKANPNSLENPTRLLEAATKVLALKKRIKAGEFIHSSEV